MHDRQQAIHGKAISQFHKMDKRKLSTNIKTLASKVKYVVVDGDIVDGIGVYPNQDRDLAILDIYAQYKLFFNLISMIPDYIHIFVILATMTLCKGPNRSHSLGSRTGRGLQGGQCPHTSQSQLSQASRH